MRDWSPPVLGLTDTLVVWRDGSIICGGILGRIDPAELAAERAELERKEELRAQPNVILLEDWRQSG